MNKTGKIAGEFQEGLYNGFEGCHEKIKAYCKEAKARYESLPRLKRGMYALITGGVLQKMVQDVNRVYGHRGTKLKLEK